MALATISSSIRECNDFDKLHNISITNVENDRETTHMWNCKQKNLEKHYDNYSEETERQSTGM